MWSSVFSICTTDGEYITELVLFFSCDCKFSAHIPAFSEAPGAGVNSPQNLSWLGATVTLLGMEKVRYIVKQEGHNFKTKSMSLLIPNNSYF